MPGNSSVTLARFGDFEFDLGTRELRRFGTRLRLEDKPARLLCILLENAPKLMSRDDLRSMLWPDGIHLDRDHGLNKCVNRLRFVLRDDSASPKFIETLSRRGYRFIGEVELLGNATFPDSASSIRDGDVGSATTPGTGGAAIVGNLAEGAASGSATASPKNARRRLILCIRLALVLLLGVAFALIRTFMATRYADTKQAAGLPQSSRDLRALSSVVIETGGGLDPEDAGFQIHAIGDFQHKPFKNVAKHGYDRLLVTSDDQGYFFRPFTAEEKAAAVSKDWKLICVCAVREGFAFADVDFGKNFGPARFDLGFLQQGGRNYVVLTQQISPELLFEKKIEFAGAGDIDHLHTFELRYDHKSETADLWIDGKLAASGYHGGQQFREDRGVLFGAAAFLEFKRGAGLFRTVRFEAQ